MPMALPQETVAGYYGVMVKIAEPVQNDAGDSLGHEPSSDKQFMFSGSSVLNSKTMVHVEIEDAAWDPAPGISLDFSMENWYHGGEFKGEERGDLHARLRANFVGSRFLG